MWIRSFLWFSLVFFLGRASAAPLELAYLTCGEDVVATVTYDEVSLEVVFDADPVCDAPLVYAGDETWIVEIDVTEAGTTVTLTGIDGAFVDELADLPGVGDGVGEDPGSDEPTGDEPETDDPGTDEPGTDEPGTDDPTGDEPATDDPGDDVPMVGNSGKPVSSLPEPAQAGKARAEDNREAARERAARGGDDDADDGDQDDDNDEDEDETEDEVEDDEGVSVTGTPTGRGSVTRTR